MQKPKNHSGSLPSLRFDFKKAVRDAKRDYPSLRKNVVFIDSQHNRRFGDESAISQLAEDDEGRETLKEAVQASSQMKSSFSQPVTLDNKTVIRTVVLYPDAEKLYDAQNVHINRAATFDHEVAHVLTKNEAGVLAENTADAYAVIRHLQRSGNDAEDMRYCGWKRAFNLVCKADKLHLSTFTVDQILIDARTADFVSLSPAETLAIAKAYAQRHTLSQKQAKQVMHDFASVSGLPFEEKTLRKIMRITMLAPENSATFYLGARVLREILKQKQSFLREHKISLSDPQWLSAGYRLQQKIEKLPASHPLRAL